MERGREEEKWWRGAQVPRRGLKRLKKQQRNHSRACFCATLVRTCPGPTPHIKVKYTSYCTVVQDSEGSVFRTELKCGRCAVK